MEQKKSLGLILKLVIIALASVAVTAVVLVIIARVELSNTYTNLIKEELKVACEELESKLSYEYDGDWGVDAEGQLTKGSDVVHDDYTTEMDDIKKKTNLEYTIFLGDTRIITTIEKNDGSGRLVGTKASDAVIAQTLKGGQDYLGTNLTIEGNKYYGYYIPLKNSDGSIIGMCFTGRRADDVSKGINSAVMICIVAAIIVVAIVIAAGLWLNARLSALMKGVSENIAALASGDMNVTVNPAITSRGDELGVIGRSTENLVGQISGIIGQLKDATQTLNENSANLSNSSDQARSASEQVASAMDDISKGAVSQADSIQTAVGNTESIGMSVDAIADSVSTLNDASDEMRKSSNQTMETLNNLAKHSEKVSESVQTIATTIESTNESAKAISGFTEAINSIASQTNLLSLNASIEAARAGEAGRGFAVVASEISDLADQSKASADKINEIVTQLIKDVSESVEVMKVLSENVAEQGAQLNATKDDMRKMSDNIGSVVSSATEISGKVDDLRTNKEGLGQIIEDLSAISEENAASTEETNASVEEMSATFHLITEDAERLNKLAEEMNETIAFFH